MTKKRQSTPRRPITAFGRTQGICVWSKEVGIPFSVLKDRLSRMHPELALDRFDYFCELRKKYSDKGKRIRAERDYGYPMTDSDGHYWETRFRVRTVDGRVYDHSKRRKPKRPQPVLLSCPICQASFWSDRAKGKAHSKICSKKCGALHAAKIAGTANRLNASVKYWEPPVKRATAGYLGMVLRPVYQNCAWCDQLTRNEKGSYCSDSCRENGYKRTRRKDKRKYKKKYKEKDCKGKHQKRTKKFGGNYVTGITARAVALRDGMKCQECGIRVEPHQGKGWQPNGWTVGHIQPLSTGADHDWNNVQCECSECNSAKSNVYSSIDDYLEA